MLERIIVREEGSMVCVGFFFPDNVILTTNCTKAYDLLEWFAQTGRVEWRRLETWNRQLDKMLTESLGL